MNMLKKENIFFNIPKKISEEVIEVLYSSDIIRIERIISENHKSPEDFWYDQSENEFVIVLQGEGDILFDDGEILSLKKGDYCFIPAHKKHRVERTSDKEKTIWLAVFYK